MLDHDQLSLKAYLVGLDLRWKYDVKRVKLFSAQELASNWL